MKSFEPHKHKDISKCEEYWRNKTFNKLKDKTLIQLFDKVVEKIDYFLVFKTNRYDLEWDGYVFIHQNDAVDSILESLSSIITSYDVHKNDCITSTAGFVGYVCDNQNIIGIGWFGKEYNTNKISGYNKFKCNFYINRRKEKLKNLF